MDLSKVARRWAASPSLHPKQSAQLALSRLSPAIRADFDESEKRRKRYLAVIVALNLLLFPVFPKAQPFHLIRDHPP
jgi:hypothetical protein